MAETEGGSGWMRRHSGLIAAVGALVVFTSWAVSNTLGRRYSSAATSIASARNDEHFLGYLSEIRQSQDRLIDISLQTRADLRATHPIADGVADRFQSLVAYYSTRVRASQLRELLFQCQRQLTYARSIGIPVGAITEVEESVVALQETLIQREQAIDAQLMSPTSDVERLQADIADYTRQFQREVFPKLKPMFDTVAKASTASFDEGERRLRAFKKSADRMSGIALVLYAVGSLVALGGKFIESPKR
jgi:hypothetical protein